MRPADTTSARPERESDSGLPLAPGSLPMVAGGTLVDWVALSRGMADDDPRVRPLCEESLDSEEELQPTATESTRTRLRGGRDRTRGNRALRLPFEIAAANEELSGSTRRLRADREPSIHCRSGGNGSSRCLRAERLPVARSAIDHASERRSLGAGPSRSVSPNRPSQVRVFRSSPASIRAGGRQPRAGRSVPES